MAKADPIETFLNAVSEPAQSALRKLRAQIAAAAPGAEEIINYGVPMFRLGGRNLVSYGAAKTHCSFYVQSPRVMEAFAAEFEGLKTSKGAVSFQPEKPLPAALVKKLVKARIDENGALATKKS
ncbi:MAG TPA: DUF1801 domain-containing protein [Devosia sp.]|nr:DUF1801 domain-containing protein [Devosia sp.]